VVLVITVSDCTGLHAMRKRTYLSVIAGLFLSSVAFAADLAKVAHTASQHRRPVAVRLLDRETAIVANRRSGTLSVIDLERFAVAAEFEIKGQPTDIDVRRRNVLVTDAEGGRLVAVEIDQSAARIKWELPMPKHPVSVRVSADGSWCSVCSMWSRKVTFVRLPQASTKAKPPQIIATVKLSFAPREQLILEDASRLLVADAFGDRLATIRLDSHKVEAVHSLSAQNIRGLALSPDGKRVLVSHQLLNKFTPPRRSDIMWGGMMSDALRVLRKEKLLDPKADVMQGSRFVMIGNATRGAGDPDAMVVTDDGRLVIALAGTSEVAVIQPDRVRLERTGVGRRPVAVVAVGDDKFLIVNQLSDSVSLLDLRSVAKKKTPLPASKSKQIDKKSGDDKYAARESYNRYTKRRDDSPYAVRHLPLGPSPKPGAVERGEAHFFDARLSLGGWFSCHSCHTDGHTTGRLADTLGDGHEGGPKRILSLLGVTETGPWAWLGNKKRLDDQLHQSLRLTMQGRKLADHDVNDMVEFLKTLKPPPPFQPATSSADRATIAQGRKLFESLECNTCHAGRTLTSDESYDVGLQDEHGSKKFSPPSLRGVGHRHRLFHDNRAASVEQVIRDHKHQLPRKLSADEQRVLIRYLKSL